MKLELLNAVILAENFESLRDWYIRTLELRPDRSADETEGYSYVELIHGTSHVFGIARADQMGVAPASPRRNAAIPQLYCSDVEALLRKVADSGGTVLFGPSYDEAFGGYSYGGFADPEGNQIWVVDRMNAAE